MPNVAVVSFLWGEWPEDRPELGVCYVRRLMESLYRHSTVPFDWFNFGDSMYGTPLPEEFRSLRWNLKKMFMFSEMAGLWQYEWVVAVDLDVVITGSIDFLLQHRSEDLVTCRGAYLNQNPGGSVVAFDPNELWVNKLLSFLMSNRKEVEAETRGSERKYYHKLQETDWGGDVSYWQDIYPGKILSYKVDGYQPGASLIRFHGKPRPHQVDEGWVKEYWR